MNAHATMAPVSVVIPAYNAAATLEDTLQSVARQNRRPGQVVVVDDGSTDDTAAVLARHDTWITIVRQSNAGLACARNAGLRAADQPWIALLDADDLCHPRRIEAQLAALSACPDAGLCASDFRIFDASGVSHTSGAEHVYSAIARHPGGSAGLLPELRGVALDADADEIAAGGRLAFRYGSLYPRIALGNVLHPPTLMFARALLDRIGGFPEDVGTMCDFVWIVRAAREAPVVWVTAPLLDYRVSNTQMSAGRYSLRRAEDILRAYAAIAAADPDLARTLGGAWRRALGEARLDAADAAAGRQLGLSLRRLIGSLQCGWLERRSFTVLAKNLLPDAVVGLLRR